MSRHNQRDMRFLHVPRNGVLTAIVALVIADLLRVLRPTFIHPKGYLDDGIKLLAAFLLFGPFCFGLALPLGTIFMRLCDSKLRKSYSAVLFRNDMSWYVLLGFAMFLSFRYVW